MLPYILKSQVESDSDQLDKLHTGFNARQNVPALIRKWKKRPHESFNVEECTCIEGPLTVRALNSFL